MNHSAPQAAQILPKIFFKIRTLYFFRRLKFPVNRIDVRFSSAIHWFLKNDGIRKNLCRLKMEKDGRLSKPGVLFHQSAPVFPAQIFPRAEIRYVLSDLKASGSLHW